MWFVRNVISMWIVALWITAIRRWAWISTRMFEPWDADDGIERIAVPMSIVRPAAV